MFRSLWNHFLVLLLITPFVFLSCSSDSSRQAQAGKNPEAGASAGKQPATTGANSVAGISWEVPKGWARTPDRPMRVATYVIPAAAGDKDSAECAVFFFGTGQGGDVANNINRWIGQIKQADGSGSEGKAKKSELQSACCKITTVEVGGTYTVSSGPMMKATGEKENYVLIGAIAPAPEGNVFFKLTGPTKTVEKARAEYNGLLKSIKK